MCGRKASLLAPPPPTAEAAELSRDITAQAAGAHPGSTSASRGQRGPYMAGAQPAAASARLGAKAPVRGVSMAMHGRGPAPSCVQAPLPQARSRPAAPQARRRHTMAWLTPSWNLRRCSRIRKGSSRSSASSKCSERQAGGRRTRAGQGQPTSPTHSGRKRCWAPTAGSPARGGPGYGTLAVEHPSAGAHLPASAAAWRRSTPACRPAANEGQGARRGMGKACMPQHRVCACRDSGRSDPYQTTSPSVQAPDTAHLPHVAPQPLVLGRPRGQPAVGADQHQHLRAGECERGAGASTREEASSPKRTLTPGDRASSSSSCCCGCGSGRPALLTPPGLMRLGRRRRNSEGSGSRHSRLAASTASQTTEEHQRGSGGLWAQAGAAASSTQQQQSGSGSRSVDGSSSAACLHAPTHPATHLRPRAPGRQAGRTRRPAHGRGRGRMGGGGDAQWCLVPSSGPWRIKPPAAEQPASTHSHFPRTAKASSSGRRPP